jgi:uncharacterized protein (DUF983 family)
MPDREPPSRGLRRAPIEGEVVGRVPRAPRRGDDDFDEGPSQEDLERFSGVTRTCPACSKEVFDDAEVCYHCGEAMTRGSEGGVPTWAMVTAGVLIAAIVLLWVVR